MRFFHCVHAEFLLVSPRLFRTRLGLALLGLGITLVWLRAHGLDSLTVALQAGALGAVVGAAGIVGHQNDRPALTITLTHPAIPLAVATGRWLAIVAPAAVLVIAMGVAGPAGCVAAGILAAAAVGGFALAVVLPLGNGAALSLFLFMAVAGTVAPERLVDLAQPGALRVAAASALELGPALWHYRHIATGDAGAVLHAIAWSGLGILVARWPISRSR